MIFIDPADKNSKAIKNEYNSDQGNNSHATFYILTVGLWKLCLTHNSHISDKKYASISSTPDSDSEEGTCTYSQCLFCSAMFMFTSYIVYIQPVVTCFHTNI